MQAYSSYKDTSVGWLGRVPEHWKKNKFKYLLREKSKTRNIELPCGSISFGNVVYKDSEKLTDETKLAYQEVLSGEFLVNPLNLNYDLKSLRTALSGINVIVSSGYIVLQSVNVVVDNYLKWLLYVFDVRHMKTLGAGIRQTITFKDIGNCTIFIPSRDEQEAIANFLDRETARIDSLIAEKQIFINLLKEKRQALINHVVTKGLDTDIKMKDSGIDWIGEVPRHWDIKRLKFVGAIQSGIAKGKDVTEKKTIAVPMLRVANVQDGYLDLNDIHDIEIEPHELERYSLKYGDVLMNEGGDNDKLGRGAVWRSQVSPCIHQNHVFALRMNKIEPEWLELITQSSYAKFYFFYYSKQSTNLASISSTNIKQTPLVVPPSKERKEIIKYLSSELSRSQELYDEVLSSIELLKEHRIALISSVVTGKIDVRNHKEKAA